MSDEKDQVLVICGKVKNSEDAIPAKCYLCNCDLFAGAFAQDCLKNRNGKAVCMDCKPSEAIEVLPEQVDDINAAIGGRYSKEELEILGSIIVNGHIEKDGVPTRCVNVEELLAFVKEEKHIVKKDSFLNYNIYTVFLMVPVEKNFYRSVCEDDRGGFSKLAKTREEALLNHQEALDMLATAKMAAEEGQSIH